MELQLVFDRLISDGSWSHVELVKYLTGVQSTLSELETRRLRETAIFTKEGEEPTTKEVERPTGMVDEAGKPILKRVSKKVYKRYRASDLFAPIEIARDLKLPLLYWSGTRWKAVSDEAKFMEKLGLVVSPNLQTLLALAAPKSNDRSMQNRALNYFIEHYSEYRSQYDVKRIQTQFLPCADGKTYAAPRDCFTNPDVTLLGFQVLHKDFIPVRDKLGVSENPDADRLVKAFLAKPELDPSKAQKIFEYMAGRMGDFNNMYWNQLRPSAFIPVQDTSGYTLKEPNLCYFESESSASFHKELFIFVNFGPLANSFLRSCGVRDEPNTVELATMLVKDPQRFWDLSSGGERYLNVIRQIASQFYMIKANRQLMNDMKSKAFLVGIKRTMTPEEEADEEFVQYRLAKATDIFIIDEPMGQQIFSPLSAPMEPSLEDFYASLGSSRLST